MELLAFFLKFKLISQALAYRMQFVRHVDVRLLV